MGGNEGDSLFVSGGKFVLGPPNGGQAMSDPGQLVGLNLTKQGVILAKGAAGAWDADIVESPTVLYDPKSGKWAMTYVGYGTTGGVQHAGVGLAYSTDGIHWTKYGTAAILPHSGIAGAPDENGASGPLLLWDNANDRYLLYYIGLTATGYESGTKSICQATATDLAGPWTRNGAVISPAASGWRSGAVWHASVVERDGTWYMFFNAGAASYERIGYATAPAIDGPWTPDDVNSPVLDWGPAGSWDSRTVGDPCVRRIGDMWVMTYYGWNTTNARDGIAVTPDSEFPLGWRKYDGNPVLPLGGAGSYDETWAGKPFVVQKGGVLYHYYTCINANSVQQIALATEGLPAATSPATPSSGAGELLMQNGASAPPVPLESETQDDWLYEG